MDSIDILCLVYSIFYENKINFEVRLKIKKHLKILSIISFHAEIWILLE